MFSSSIPSSAASPAIVVWKFATNPAPPPTGSSTRSNHAVANLCNRAPGSWFGAVGYVFAVDVSSAPRHRLRIAV